MTRSCKGLFFIKNDKTRHVGMKYNLLFLGLGINTIFINRGLCDTRIWREKLSNNMHTYLLREN